MPFERRYISSPKAWLTFLRFCENVWLTFPRIPPKVQLGEAAKRDVGTGTGQIPDMSSFQSGGGWFKLPSGYVIQAFEASFDSNGLYINFPIPFPSSVIAIAPGVLMSTPASPSQQFPSIQRDVNDLTRFFAKYNIGGMNSSYFIAIGK
ncbi:hypothetical protein PZS70_16475 [Citrobacter freundii]|nr:MULTISPECIES: hypothetical protein [Citrobacter freundii complex]KYC16216.1 hypothetical protein WM45_20700 [Citrobacter sp. AATXR]MEA8841000.1 hypothetical protein [Citrobacter freundii]MEA8850678.1 hypothetical protein [Citrobacter freundii]